MVNGTMITTHRSSHTSVSLWNLCGIERIFCGIIMISSVKNPSTSANTVDVPIFLDAIKCRYPNCEPPAQPGLELPATARPSTALYWSNDSHWSFAFAGSSTRTYLVALFKEKAINRILRTMFSEPQTTQ